MTVPYRGAVAEPPDLARRTGYLLYKAGLQAQRGFEEALAPTGLGMRELMVLAFAADAELSQQDVARRLGLDPTLIVTAVDILEERSLVERRRDPRDRRRYVLAVTEAGRALIAEAEAVAARAEDAFLGALSPSQRTQLNRLLRSALAPALPWLRG